MQELSLDEALRELIRLKKQNPSYRCAVLFRYGNKKVTDELRKMLKNAQVSWLKAEDSQISALSVELAKGLEFDAVVAVTDLMTEEEKYVAFTRALDHLMVVGYHYDGKVEEPAELLISEAGGDSRQENEEEPEEIEEIAAETEEMDEPPLPAPEFSNDEEQILSGFIQEMRSCFMDFAGFSNAQLHALQAILRGEPTVYAAGTNGRKTTLLALAAKHFHATAGIPSVLIAPARLRENEFAAIEKLSVRCGYAVNSISELQQDPRFLNRKYDLVFIPMELMNHST